MLVCGRLLQVEYSISMGSKFLILSFLFTSLQVMSQVISSINSNDSTTEKRIIIFINGNRGPKFNKYTTNNLLSLKDSSGYWYKYDDTIISRFQPVTPIYFDGHHPVKSSMHKSNLRFIKAYCLSRFCWLPRKSRWVLNTKYNPEGFQERVNNGKSAGKNFLIYLNEQNLLGKKVTVDIVSHSMGYAYSLGLIEVIKSEVNFGKMLAISPESAGLQGADWSLFQEVWQYGGNENDPICLQDGIACQEPLKGIEKVPTEKGGRVFIPKSWPNRKKGFLKSHHLNWFQWFYVIKSSDRGYFSR